MSSLLQAQGKLGEAEALSSETLASMRTSVGSQHPGTFSFMCNLGVLLMNRGKLGEAEALFSEALMGRNRVLGRTHPDTQKAYTDLLCVLTAQGKTRDVADVKAQFGRHK